MMPSPTCILLGTSRFSLLKGLTYWFTFLLVSFTLSCGTDPSPTSDSLLLNALKTQNWDTARQFFKSSQAFEEFPLINALKQQATWAGVKRVREMDRHLIFEVDLTQQTLSPPQLRYVFWMTAPPILSIDESTGPQPPEKVIGWADPYPVELTHIDPRDIRAPRRFSATSYRELNGHRSSLKRSQYPLGILGDESEGLIEDGWAGHFSILSVDWIANTRKRKLACRKPQSRWSKVSHQLANLLHHSCNRPLRFAAQRARKVQKLIKRPLVEFKGEGGGNDIRREQEEKVTNGFNPQTLSDSSIAVTQQMNGVDFNGRITLRQTLEDIEERRIPRITEAISIAPSLTRCVQRVLQEQSKKYLPKSRCDLKLTLYFEVIPDLGVSQ